MRIKLITFLSLFLLAQGTCAQQNDPVALAIYGTLGLLLSGQAPTDPSVPSDVVAGKCEYEGSNCNGAKVTLIDGEDGTRYREKTLTAQGEFRYINAGKNQEYFIELSWPVHSFKEKRKVLSGKFYHFKLIKNQKN